MNRKNIGFGRVGTLVLVFQFLAYVGYCSFTNYPQNVMSQYYGGVQVTTLMNLIGSLVGYLINYFFLAPRIGRVKSMKGLCVGVGALSLVLCAAVVFIPPTIPTLWCIAFVLVLIVTQIWISFGSMLIGNWFPRRKGTVMGIVTMAFPLVTGVCLGLFYGVWYGTFGATMAATAGDLAKSAVRANLVAFAPYWIAALIGVIVCLVFLKDFPEQCGEFRDNDPSMTPEQAREMTRMQIEARKNSVWKRSKIWGCKDWWLNAIPSSLLLSCAIAFMVQIIPVLNMYGEDLEFLAIPGFILMNTGVSTVLFGLSIFACFGSWLLGVIDTKYGTKTAIFITSILMLLAGVLGMLNNAACAVAACWMLGLFMGASSNFGLSAIVRYWRGEDFPAVMYGAPPLGTIIGACFPFIIATLGAQYSYTAAFLFVAVMAVICIICNRLFDPRGIIAYDNKLRQAAGLPIDDVLEQRLDREKQQSGAAK